ncbi:MAG TPA: leucine-rich repeat domain-containing protein, partial [Oligoflexus sp.]|uniref:leucine-rich repeat domain-containing protein n=1 Tax=Oligoflexus sp. TaxID=1971216 RepID=UPI002D61989B
MHFRKLQRWVASSLFSLSIAAACGRSVPPSHHTMKAVANDASLRLVRVDDTSVTPPVKRLMVVSGGRGYYIETNGDSNCPVLKAFGFHNPDINSLPTWSMTSLEFGAAKPALQPTLQCLTDPTQQAAQIRGLRVLAEVGRASRYFFLFPAPTQKNKFYELGCRELVTAFSWQEPSALAITTTTLADADLVADMNCRAGTPFPQTTIAPPAGTFQDWCTRTNLSEGDRYTMDTLLQKSGKSTCVEAEAELRKPAFLNLDLSGQSLDSIGPIESLQWIRSLDLSNNNLTDITGLGKLTRLTGLKVKNNGVSNIQALSALSNLKTLELDDNDITSVGPLRNLRFLDTISITFNPRLRPFEASHTFFETCIL